LVQDCWTSLLIAGQTHQASAMAMKHSATCALTEAGPSGLLVKRLRPSAVLPARGSEQAAGFDLAAADPVVVPAGGKAIVKTGLSIAIPEGTYARIAPRSGLAAKRMINCGAGVVDFDYRGEVGVVLFNHGPDAFEVAVGDRVAQLILEKVSMVGCMEVDTLDETQRGVGGFGSTGVAQTSKEVVPAAAKTDEVAAATSAAATEGGTSLCVRRLRPSAALPVRGSGAAAGFDLAAAEAASVKAGGKAIVKTGWAIAIPWGTYARIAPRSGLAAKRMIQVGAGVVDYDYRGEVGVVLFNHGTEDFEVAVGDRIAQLVLEEISMAPCVEVESLDDTARGAGGFGSTGVAEQVGHTPQPSKRLKAGDDSQGTPVKVSEEPSVGIQAVDGGKDVAEVTALRRELAVLRAELADLAAAQRGSGGVA